MTLSPTLRLKGCAERCPGCAHRDYSREESEARNNAWLAKELAPWAGVIRPIVSPSGRVGYRRKTLLHTRFVDGAWAAGMIRMHGREEEFIPIPDCPLHALGVNERIRAALQAIKIPLPLVYILVSGDALTLVIKSTRKEEWASELAKLPATGALWVNWNPVAGKRAVDGRYLELLRGEEWLDDRGLLHGPTAFRQQIPELEEAALDLAESHLAGAGVQTLVDLYSGLGASLERWKKRGWNAQGVELAGESVEAAAKNGFTLLRGRVEERLPQVDQFLAGKDFLLYTNPPRSGHGAPVLEWIDEKRPARIAYLSCHPRSLAGDLRRLEASHKVTALHPFDFFPQTGHVETLALLERL